MKPTDPAYAAPRPEPIPPGTSRPLWSVMIPTFNCAKLLRKTLGSVLEQDPGPEQMQIQVVDDCSTKDDPEEVVRELGKGRVEFYRREKNGGLTANFNTCLQRSRGQLIHLLHGDDFVYPNFYRRVGELVAANPDVAGYFIRCFKVDEDDQIVSLLWRADELEKPTHDPGRLLYLNIYQPPGAIIRRSFHETYGGYMPTLSNVCDWEMYLRVIVEGGAVSLNEPLAAYRVSASNDSSKMMRTGENVRDVLRLGRIMADRLPDFDYQRYHTMASEAALGQARRAAARGDQEAAAANWKMWREITPLQRRFRRRISCFVRDMLRWQIPLQD